MEIDFFLMTAILGVAVIKSFTVASLIGIIIVLILLLFSALVSGSENAYFSLKPSEIESIKHTSSNKIHKVIAHLEKPKLLLATILISNSFINTAIVILSSYIVNLTFDFSQSPLLGLLIQIGVITSIILFAGDILPKVIATQKAMQIALFMALPLEYLTMIFKPFSWILINSSAFIDKRISKKSHNISIEELSDAIEITSNNKNHNEDSKILKGIVNLSDIDVKEIMKSRIDVVAVDINTSFNSMLEKVVNCGFSRIPVYKDNFDHIEGILYIKNLLAFLNEPPDFQWRKLIKPAFFVPENKKINDLLKEFQEKKIHLAIVVDEYGGTSGIVTLEDIIEEIVGDIKDEFDTVSNETLFTKIDENTYIFEGKINLNDFYKILNIEDKIFGDIKGESDTLAGLILENQGKIPDLNSVILINNFRFVIVSADNRRIKKIKLILENNS